MRDSMYSVKAKLILVLVAVMAGLGLHGSAATGRVVFPYPMNVAVSTKLVSEQDKSAHQKTTSVDWLCGLTPLSSTRADVERILGKGKRHPNGFTYIYENDSRRVDVIYSAGPCKVSGVERWNVPEDTVIRMEISQKQNILVQDLGLDPKKYTRLQLSHPENWVQYLNKEDGLIVHTIISGKAEELYLITREPAAKDALLKCASS